MCARRATFGSAHVIAVIAVTIAVAISGVSVAENDLNVLYLSDSVVCEIARDACARHAPDCAARMSEISQNNRSCYSTGTTTKAGSPSAALPPASESAASKLTSKPLSTGVPMSAWSDGQSIARFIQESQDHCDKSHGFATFRKQAECVNTIVDTASSNADARLYRLTADKLVDDVSAKRVSVAAARVELQRLLVDMRAREVTADSAAETARLLRQDQEARAVAERAAERARQVAEEDRILREARDAAAQAAAAQQQAEAQYANAVRFCVAEAYRRQNANPNQLLVAAQNLGMGLGGGSIQNSCANNPNWYQAVPVPPQVTQCARDPTGVVTCVTR